MRIVLPVSPHDRHLLDGWVKIIQHLRCGTQHQLHMVVPLSCEVNAIEAKKELEDYFDSVDIHIMESEPLGGWPIGPNYQFYQAARFMAQTGPNLPWFFCELDCRPIRTHAFDALASRYASSGVPFLGNVSPTPWRSDDGRIVPSLEGKDDIMMSGCAIYPGSLINHPICKPLMDDLSKGMESTEVPWDLYLRYVQRKLGMSHTDLLANHWNTVNYHMEDGALVCEARPSHEVFDQKPNFEQRKCDGAIHPEAVLIHGCKDDSLTELILADAIPSRLAGSFTSKSKASKLPPVANDAKVEALERQLAEMQAMLKQALGANAQVQKPVEAKTEPEAPIAEAQEEKPAKPSPNDRILGYFAENKGSKRRLGELAIVLGISQSTIRTVVEQNPDKLTITGPANWVSEVQPEVAVAS